MELSERNVYIKSLDMFGTTTNMQVAADMYSVQSPLGKLVVHYSDLEWEGVDYDVPQEG